MQVFENKDAGFDVAEYRIQTGDWIACAECTCALVNRRCPPSQSLPSESRQKLTSGQLDAYRLTERCCAVVQLIPRRILLRSSRKCSNLVFRGNVR